MKIKAAMNMNRTYLKIDCEKKVVIPAKAGIHNLLYTLDSRLHGNDRQRPDGGDAQF